MSIGIQEEIIAGIWALCAVSAFGFGYDTWGWAFGVKASLDTIFAVYMSWKDVMERRAA